jgi:hypothetical protein
MSSFLRHACAALFLAVTSTSCVLAIGTGTKDPRVPRVGAQGGAVAAQDGAAPTNAADAAAAPAVAAKAAARKAEKKAREVTYAKMELAIAQLDAERELKDATLDVERSRHDLEAAQRNLEHFQKVERALALEDQVIDLDRAKEQAHQQQQELEELMAMYKADEYAKLTKELVIQRGKFQMEMAQRSLELARKRAADREGHEWPTKERELSLALRKAQDGLESSEAKLVKTKASTELELLRAKHKVEEAERPDDEDEAAGAKGAPAPQGAGEAQGAGESKPSGGSKGA